MDESTSDKPLLVGMATAGVKLDCGIDKLYALIKTRELDSFLDGNRRKITMASIERLVEKRLAAANGEFQRGKHPFRKVKSETTTA